MEPLGGGARGGGASGAGATIPLELLPISIQIKSRGP